MHTHLRMIMRGTNKVQSPPTWLVPVGLFALGFVCGILFCIITEGI